MKNHIQRLVLAIFSLSLSSACATSIVVKKPLKVTNNAERMEAYEKYAPPADVDISSGNVASFSLRGGKVVDSGEDLLRLVSPSSPTFRRIEAARNAEKTGSAFAFWGGMMAAAGGTTVGGTLVAITAGIDDPDPYIYSLLTGLGVAVVGGLTALIGKGIFSSKAKAARKASYQTYEEDLLQNLGLCRTANKVTPCQTQISQRRK